jgi:hypothetical protein
MLTPMMPQFIDNSPCMAKHRRLGWESGICFTSYGSRIGIQVNHVDALELLPSCLPPRWESMSSPEVDALYSLRVGSERLGIRQFHIVYIGSGQVTRTNDLQEALFTLESVVHGGVAVFAQNFVFVHAGVVGWRGRAVVLPGRSKAGKSRLAEALVRAGATYYSDEFAVLDSQGRVHPYPKPISIRQGDPLPPLKRRPEAEGWEVGSDSLPIGLIAFTEYKSGAKWRPKKLTPGKAVLNLFDNTVLARYKPELALSMLDNAVIGAEVIRGNRDEAENLAPMLLDMIEKK